MSKYINAGVIYIYIHIYINHSISFIINQSYKPRVEWPILSPMVQCFNWQIPTVLAAGYGLGMTCGTLGEKILSGSRYGYGRPWAIQDHDEPVLPCLGMNIHLSAAYQGGSCTDPLWDDQTFQSNLDCVT